MGIFDYLTSSAVSLTVSGNTGISPFLTLLLLGIIEKSDPTLLNMDGYIEKILSSWISIIVLAILTGLEFLGKCIPVVDEIIDSVEIFVVPVISIFASLGTMGILDLVNEASGRRLSIADGLLTFLKAVLVVVGICLALAIHLFKMLIRLIGLTCCAGCCQPCITVVEITCVLVGVLVAIFIQQLAIFTFIILAVAAGYAIKRKFIDKDMPENSVGGAQAPAQAQTPETASSPPPNASNATGKQSASNNADVENPPPSVPEPEPMPEPLSVPVPDNNTPAPWQDVPPSINPELVAVTNNNDSQDVVEVEAVPVPNSKA